MSIPARLYRITLVAIGMAVVITAAASCSSPKNEQSVKVAFKVRMISDVDEVNRYYIEELPKMLSALLGIPVRYGEGEVLELLVPVSGKESSRSLESIIESLRVFGNMELLGLATPLISAHTEVFVESVSEASECEVPVFSQAWLGRRHTSKIGDVRKVQVVKDEYIPIGWGEMVIREAVVIYHDQRSCGVAVKFLEGRFPETLREWNGRTVALAIGEVVFASPVQVSVAEDQMVLSGEFNSSVAARIADWINTQNRPYRIEFPAVSMSPESQESLVRAGGDG